MSGDSKDAKDVAIILRFAVKVVNERGHLPTSEVATLRAAGVSDQEVVEVIARPAVNIFTSYFNHIAGTEIDLPSAHTA